MSTRHPLQERLAIGALLGAALASCDGCGGPQGYQLHIYFPSAQAEADCAQLEVWALEPGEVPCADFVDGIALPREEATPALHEVLANPPERGPNLRGLPSGLFWFLVEGFDAQGAWILSACVERALQQGGSGAIEVRLEEVCAPIGPEVVGNLIDEDCDRMLDECVEDTDCDDHNPCTANLCVEEVCHWSAYPDGSPCDDATACTPVSSCRSGQCTGPSKDCSDLDRACVVGWCNPETGVCEEQRLDDGLGCDDGLFCTVEDACWGGICVGQANPCDDSEACTDNRCDEIADQCKNPLHPVPGAETQSIAGACANQVDDDCDGLVDAEDPSCGPCQGDADCEAQLCHTVQCLSQQCVYTPGNDGAACEDGLFCTTNERCLAGRCETDPVDCSHLSVGCMQGYCDEEGAACDSAQLPDNTPCEDGDFCTANDKCQAGICVGGPARDCVDADPCTVDGCSSEAQLCLHDLQPVPDAEGPAGDATCGNGLDDDCDGAADSDDVDCHQCTVDGDCDDGNPCTTDHCRLSTGRCYVSSNSGAACDDGVACTGPDVCVLTVCVGALPDADNDQHGAASCGGTDCDDSNASIPSSESLNVAGTCADLVDNDCDGAVDGADNDCLELSGICDDTGWCWEHPLPLGVSLYDVWAFDANNAWAVGAGGVMLRWDGNAWTLTETGTSSTLSELWGASPTSLWVAGSGGAVLEWDGQRWNDRSPPGVTDILYGLWGVSSQDLWVFGYEVMAHRTGSSWSMSDAPSNVHFFGLWGTAADDYWSTGTTSYNRYYFYHWSGASWDRLADSSTYRIVDLYGFSGSDIWAVGNNNTVFHYDGTAWQREYPPSTAGDLSAVWGANAADVWVGSTIPGQMLRRTPSGWSSVTLPVSRSISNIHGSAADDIWAVGSGGTLLRWRGQQWVGDVDRIVTQNVEDIWCHDAQECWAVSDRKILRRLGGRWSVAHEVGSSLNALWGSAPDAVWFVGDDGEVACWNGSLFQDLSIATLRDLVEVSGVPGGETWLAASDGATYRRAASDSAWRYQSSGTTSLQGIWAIGPNEVWACGNSGKVVRWNGSAWSPVVVPGLSATASLNAVWGSAPDELWVGGANGTLFHLSGTQWTDVGAAGDPVKGIVGTAANDVWILAGRRVYRYQGLGLQPQGRTLPVNPFDIWALSGGTAWVCGTDSSILRFDD